jgi:hypothetical protein
MAQQLDLLKIAQEEQKGDLFKLLDSIYKRFGRQADRVSRCDHLGRRERRRGRQARGPRIHRHVRAERHAHGA